MSGRNLDPATAAALASGKVQPAILAQLRFKSGTERVWSGVGDLSWNGLTWTGLGNFASMGAITEASAVQAEGTSVTLSGIGLSSIGGHTLMYESLNDIQVGGPAKIWFGLMSAPGTFIGAPYLVFSGVMDKPVVTTSPNGSSITLPLENRLVNLQRPSQRRYTTADQHLEFPTDTGFNWVEQLNDQGLRWGS